MKSIFVKYFQHFKKIIQIMQPHLTFKSNLNQITNKNEFQGHFSSDQQIQKELESLKNYIQNLLKYCKCLQNENRLLKSKSSIRNEILEKNSYTINEYKPSYEKTTKSYQFNKIETNPQFKRQSALPWQAEPQSLLKDSLNRISLLKNQVSSLSQKLNQMKTNYSIYELDQTQDTFRKDILNQCSFNQKNHLNDQYDLDYLLCHQELNIQQTTVYQQISQQAVNNLIAKGISYHQTKALRQKDFQYLNQIIQKYQQESQYSAKLKKKQSNSYYGQNVSLL